MDRYATDCSENECVKPLCLGRHILGPGVVTFGVTASVWHRFKSWNQIDAVGKMSHPEILDYSAGTIELLGGAAIQFRRTVQAGALMLFIILSVFALLRVPSIVRSPLVYDHCGNFFEQLSLVAGALIIFSGFAGAYGLDIPEMPRSDISSSAYVSFRSWSSSFSIFQAPRVWSRRRFLRRPNYLRRGSLQIFFPRRKDWT